MKTPAFGGALSVAVAFAVCSLLVVSCQPLQQCDDPDEHAEETYGKLQAIPPVNEDPAGLADEPVKFAPSKTQHDLVKSRNSKFLGVGHSSEEQ